MTVTDQRPALDPDLIARGRELVRPGRMPSKRELQKHLGKGWHTVNAVLSTLVDERSRRPREARAKLRQLASRKRPVQQLRARFQAVNVPAQVSTLPPVAEPVPQVIPEALRKRPAIDASPDPEVAPRRIRTWPILLVSAMAFVAIWGGWVGLGKLAGFGPVNLLPGIAPENGWATIDTAITLPMGMEAYSAYAVYVWLHRATPDRARRFAIWSSLGAVALGMGGQTAYHLMTAAGMTAAPWQITTVVSCLPVAVFGLAAALVHMVRAGEER
jgi:hypothetical protein